jgi:hypothetical protein
MCADGRVLPPSVSLPVQVDEHYWYQMYLDDLPIWGMIGEVRPLLDFNCTCLDSVVCTSPVRLPSE